MSEIPHSDRKDWMYEAVLFLVAGLVEERSSSGSSQQLKPPLQDQKPRVQLGELGKYLFKKSDVIHIWSVNISQDNIGIKKLPRHDYKSAITVG